MSSINSSDDTDTNEGASSKDIWYRLTIIGRIIMTLYSFQALFFLYNFIINFIFLPIGMLFFTESLVNVYLGLLLQIFFTFLCYDILIIPTYEFLIFSFLSYNNIFAHLESIILTSCIINNNNESSEIKYNESDIISDIILIIIEISYIIGFFLGFSSSTVIGKDIIREIIFIIIYSYYLFIFFGYLFVAIHLKIQLILKTLEEYKGLCDFLKNIFGYTDKHINELFHSQNSNKHIPKINLLSFTINPLLDDKNKTKNSCYEKNILYTFKNNIRFFCFLVSFIISMIISSEIKVGVLSYFVIIFFYISFYFLSSMLNFPYAFSCECKDQSTNLILVSLSSIISFIIFIFSLILLMIFLFMDENTSELSHNSINPIYYKPDNTILKPNLCLSSINGMHIHLFLPFINDAYYYKDWPGSSLSNDKYRKLFFDNEIYDITPIGELTSGESDRVKMIQYNVQIKEKIGEEKKIINEMTILSIKGTTNRKDCYIDFQLYLPSVFLSYLSYFSLLSKQKDSYSFGFMEYSLSLPYRVFSHYLIIDQYLQNLIDAYEENQSRFKKNVIIVGHSLGGGLAKLLGRIKGKQAISLSGPGTNAFHSLWEYEGSSENFEISTIDLVPDMDLVPRVEVSGGTIYRIICKEGPFDCHSKELSLCEVLIMCGNPNYKFYCKNIAKINDDKIEKIKESTKL